LRHVLQNQNISSERFMPQASYQYKHIGWKMAERLRTMERSMLGISLRGKTRNTEIRKRTKLKEIFKIMAELK